VRRATHDAHLALPDDDLKRSKHVGVVLSVLSESYIGAFVGWQLKRHSDYHLWWVESEQGSFYKPMCRNYKHLSLSTLNQFSPVRTRNRGSVIKWTQPDMWKESSDSHQYKSSCVWNKCFRNVNTFFIQDKKRPTIMKHQSATFRSLRVKFQKSAFFSLRTYSSFLNHSNSYYSIRNFVLCNEKQVVSGICWHKIW